ncbi:hypothetical protein H2201_008022 [Coniosporium apollinis]|uniref:Uncharacterized protein n=1 Tax=Coniosporium apollinis TaxID=61459 RepID=A0ABQ9NKT1_9PEZI|nr:hypothetical protein H2201_008022 [Coniosporium apollinis]
MLAKRDTSVLDLQNYETFLWEGADGSDVVLGNFTVYTLGDTENILSMEKFEPLLTSVELWDWVNGADDHSFLMVAGAGDCGDNPHRVPYLVHSIQYDEAANTARLDATTDEWKNLVHSYELRVGRVTPQPGIKLRRKDGDDSTAFSVTKAFPFEVKVEAGPVAGKLECDDCELSGSLNVNMHVTFGLPDIIDKAFKKEVVLKKSALPQPIPLYAITLGGFMRLGAFTEVVIGVEATGFEGTIAVESGATATVPDTAFVEVDFKNLDGGIKRSSWVPKVDVAPVTISGQMSTKVQVFVAPALKLEASALDFGYEAAIELKAPYYEAQLSVERDTAGGLCKKPDVTAALSVKGTLGAELKFEAGKLNDKTPLEWTIGTLPLFEVAPICLPLDRSGKPTSAAPSPTKSRPPTKPTSTAKSTPTCKVSSGAKGTCISTGSCKSLGGYSEAGHCAGPDDIQGSGDTCTANGVSGTCMPTGSCPDSTGVSVPGHCRGGDDIQCCITKEHQDQATAKNVCTINKAGLKTSGFVGECISTSSCKRLKGTSTPGFCPGGDNVQCCTYGTCDGKPGVCEPVSTCTGTKTPGLCGGGDNIQCCSQDFKSGHPGQEK